MRGLEVDERRALGRVFVIAAAGSLAATVCLATTFLGSLPQPAHLDPARLADWRRFRFVLFVNNASLILPLAVSIGLVCGIGMGLQRHAARTLKRAVLVATAAFCIVMFAMSSWLLPPAFRALSQVIRGQPSTGQPAASTLGDARRAMLAVERTPTAGPGTIRSGQVRYYFAWAWPFATFSLGLFAMSLIHRGRVARIVLGIAGCAVYFYVMRDVAQWLVWDTRLPPIVVAWWPNAMFVVLSIIIMAMTRAISRVKHA
jgi:hypothetical protein